MAWTQARRRLRWSSFSEKTFWLLVNSARMSFLCHPRRKEDQTHPAFPRQPSQGPTGACGWSRGSGRPGSTLLMPPASVPLSKPSKPPNRAAAIPQNEKVRCSWGSVSPWPGHPGDSTPNCSSNSCSLPGQAQGSADSWGQAACLGLPGPVPQAGRATGGERGSQAPLPADSASD